MKMASRLGKRYATPCQNETMAVMDAVEAVYAKGDAHCHVSQVNKYLLACDKCLADAKLARKARNPSTLFYLTQYLDRNKNKVK